MILKFRSCSLHGSQHPRHHHAGSALDVVVEGAILFSVVFKETESVLVPKILKLDEGLLAKSDEESKHDLEGKDAFYLATTAFINSSMNASYCSPVTLF